jgi:hypothetical protein
VQFIVFEGCMHVPILLFHKVHWSLSAAVLWRCVWRWSSPLADYEVAKVSCFGMFSWHDETSPWFVCAEVLVVGSEALSLWRRCCFRRKRAPLWLFWLYMGCCDLCQGDG